MAEGKIPLRMNGAPLMDVANVSFQGTRNVIQRATTGGVKQSFGQLKVQIQLTFLVREDKQLYLRAAGALAKEPIPHNIGFDLGADSYNCLRGIVSSLTGTSDQDGSADLQLSVMFEEIEESP